MSLPKIGRMGAQPDRRRDHDGAVGNAVRQARLQEATLAADQAEYRRTTMGQRVEQAMILSKELGELAARGLRRAGK